jgi:hypothetical protein
LCCLKPFSPALKDAFHFCVFLALGKGSGSNQDIAVKLKQQAQNFGGPSKSPPHSGLLGVERDQWCVDVDADERQRFDEVLERALAELEPVCLAEQNFCVSFFQLDVLSPTTKVCAFIFHNAFGHEQIHGQSVFRKFVMDVHHVKWVRCHHGMAHPWVVGL